MKSEQECQLGIVEDGNRSVPQFYNYTLFLKLMSAGESMSTENACLYHTINDAVRLNHFPYAH